MLSLRLLVIFNSRQRSIQNQGLLGKNIHYKDKGYVTNLWDTVLRRIMKKGDLKLFLVTVFKHKMISYIKPVMGEITTTFIGIT